MTRFKINITKGVYFALISFFEGGATHTRHNSPELCKNSLKKTQKTSMQFSHRGHGRTRAIHFWLWPTVLKQLCPLTPWGIQGSVSSCFKGRPEDLKVTHTFRHWARAKMGTWRSIHNSLLDTTAHLLLCVNVHICLFAAVWMHLGWRDGWMGG